MDLKKEMRFTFVWWLLLFSVLLGVMYYVADHKTIVIADGGYKSEKKENPMIMAEHKILEMNNTNPGSDFLRISLPEGISAEQVSVENRYFDRELDIFIKGAKEAFYENTPVQGDVDFVEASYYEKVSGGILLRILMKGVYEFQSSMGDGELRIQRRDLRDCYRMLVVVDTERESDALASVVRKLQDGFNNSEIKLLLAGSGEADISETEVLEFMDAVAPDFYIRLKLSESEDATQYGITGFYNDRYFIPNQGNVWLADVLTRNVTIACGNRAVGLIAVEEENILRRLRIPSAEVSLGYLSNEKERSLLQQDFYQEKLTKGILDALEEVYTGYHE